MAQASGMLGDGSKAVKVHHLVKAPENSADSVRIRESWDATEPATVYKTPEILPDGTPCTAATVIFRTRGCVWWWKSGCTFCGYFNDVRDDVTADDLFAQWEESKRRLDDFEGCSMVKVYTSGTFFEDRENPPEWQEAILKETHERDLHLVIEAQAQMCTPEKLAWVAERHPGCTVAIGLEAYDDTVLRFHVNKGFSTKQWHRSIDMLRENGLRVKTYLLFKPPFMSEGDALQHTSKWISQVAPLSDDVSVNPMNIQKRTIVERLFRNREYRPPWLWSLVEMLEQVHDDVLRADARIIVHPTAGGRIRGAHNCGACDMDIVAAIERYSVSGDIGEFAGLDCDCKRVWRTEVDNDLSLPTPLGTGVDRRGSPVDLARAP
ncbi:MAG: archaeosine biosynthesis radical SAM protein RaSEA [Candidatus Thermoplasmatota archaeon]|nr:archaeosine biosynthesis radical SAM protein RaSEA [Candidatus Thermoplasmatota archaeon]MEE3231556.1 archaeosine biosynthesis radical SAM protein RaSEA [Candidatus Thermoplasmatota archaeon]MEE3318884.1 archaeosine biosynthesis radical SAM protein RaSEA [Candidatus Thermoplasmatota archaeon]|tara:strand:+ start:968 stop:2101 length:1134 start_codon:yes stop_codon:yes gene_type:complete